MKTAYEFAAYAMSHYTDKFFEALWEEMGFTVDTKDDSYIIFKLADISDELSAAYISHNPNPSTEMMRILLNFIQYIHRRWGLFFCTGSV